ncbi:MAG: mitochondrial fission ELM1 family protein [Alphaproteobacteria bacterium]|nr:mitochondrial fission ELM1 family protein [Alphaproteobacteria bacterium]MDD9919849.1 mitochondrial fission ELM1 family protein [Alphaproteobacteria bacterium]
MMPFDSVLEKPAPLDVANMRVWILHDGRIGHFNQSLGIAEGLGLKNPQVIDLKKEPLHWLWRRIAPAKAWEMPSSPYPDILIATGWQASHISRAIKTVSPRTFTVQMMRPSGDMGDYDVVAMPLHDCPPARDNVVSTVGAPNRVSAERLKQEADRWETRLLECPTPRLAVLIGGPTRGFEFGVKEAQQVADNVIKIAREKGYSLLVTASRRTGPVITEYLRNTFQKSGLPIYFWTGMDSTRRDNPYLAYLALCEAVVVTADSISMISESCTAGKPVYVWGLERLKRKKFKTFLDILQKQRRIAPFTGDVTLRAPDYPLADTQQVVGFIQGSLARRAGRS